MLKNKCKDDKRAEYEQKKAELERMKKVYGFEENFYWQSAEQKYIELEIPVGEKKVIYIACENEEWARSYLFNF